MVDERPPPSSAPLYAASGDAGALPPAATYAEYARWEEEARAARRAPRRKPGGSRSTGNRRDSSTSRRRARARRPHVRGRHGAPRGPARSPTPRKAGARRGCTLFATLLAAFDILLHRLSGQDDVVVGVPSAGQSSWGRDDLVGHCVNFLPVRSLLPDGATVRDFLKATKGRVLEAYEHQNATYGTLVRKLALPRDPSRLPLMEVQFNVEKVGGDRVVPGLAVTVDPTRRGSRTRRVPERHRRPRGARPRLNFKTELFSRDTIRRWLGHFETLSRNRGRSDARVDALDLLSAPELVHVLGTQRHGGRWPGPHDPRARRSAGGRDAGRHGRRLGRADALPRARRARRRLAAHLAAKGAGSGTLVGLCVERSEEMPVALLGILASGAAYVPLDPAFPKERLALILEDARPR